MPLPWVILSKPYFPKMSIFPTELFSLVWLDDTRKFLNPKIGLKLKHS